MLSDKIILLAALRARIADLPRPLVFTNGVFDVLHRGHVVYLHAARACGAALLVGLNSDSSVRTLHKGDDRPLNREDDRAIVLAALASVTAVTLFTDTTPLALLELARPDIYVKGGDYDVATLAESTLVASWGGRSCTIPFVAGFSTTDFVNRIRSA